MPYVSTPEGQKPAPTSKPESKAQPKPEKPKQIFTDWASI
ncbi:hypothetical protein shim_07070 [Shimia sp. SK013]|nr:hypothetical protein shim_07070 [Shimia sp. SK013]